MLCNNCFIKNTIENEARFEYKEVNAWKAVKMKRTVDLTTSQCVFIDLRYAFVENTYSSFHIKLKVSWPENFLHKGSLEDLIFGQHPNDAHFEY